MEQKSGTRVSTFVPLLVLVLMMGCAAGQPAGVGSLAGTVFVTGTDQPLEGVRVTLTETRNGGDDLESWSSVSQSNGAGGFVFPAADDPDPPKLRRGEQYLVEAFADGFYRGEAWIRFERGMDPVRLELDVIADDDLEGVQVQELSDDSIKNPEGTLIEEVLRQQGRLPRR